jgi:hypothetical protein
MPTECQIRQCQAPVKARGWCLAHYKRYLKTGDPEGSTRKPKSERFWAKVEKTEACWLWRGTMLTNGYGNFLDDGRYVRAHRWSYESVIAPIPAGLDLDHLCRVRHCVNPAHLEPVSRSTNLSRGTVGYTAKQRAATVTHCPQGHAYDEQNTSHKDTRYTPGGARRCRACAKEYSRQYRARIARNPPPA